MLKKVYNFFAGKDPVNDLTFYSFWFGLCLSEVLVSLSAEDYFWLAINLALCFMAWHFTNKSAALVRGLSKQ